MLIRTAPVKCTASPEPTAPLFPTNQINTFIFARRKKSQIYRRTGRWQIRFHFTEPIGISYEPIGNSSLHSRRDLHEVFHLFEGFISLNRSKWAILGVHCVLCAQVRVIEVFNCYPIDPDIKSNCAKFFLNSQQPCEWCCEKGNSLLLHC